MREPVLNGNRSMDSPFRIKQSVVGASEQAYATRVVFSELLGIDYVCSPGRSGIVEITVDGADGAITMPDVFFARACRDWLKVSTLPDRPLRRVSLDDCEYLNPQLSNEMPVLYGDPSGGVCIQGSRIHLPVDILGSAFFMLTRYEEAAQSKIDSHGRFPGRGSVAASEGFLDRPIVDEYIELLWAAMIYLWPHARRREFLPKVNVSCDLDSPHSIDVGMSALLRGLGRDIYRGRDIRLAAGNATRRVRGWLGDFEGDPHWNAIEWIMDVNEGFGNKVAFYFVAGSDHSLDPTYRLRNPVMLKLLSKVLDRGHEVGLHGSYNSTVKPGLLKKEAAALQRALGRVGSSMSFGGRQHYLRWSALSTPRLLANAGLTYDSTLGYADYPGFRCGTCKDFSLYDLEGRRAVPVVEKPLILMEGSLISPLYMGLGISSEAYDTVDKLKKRAFSVGGSFNILWHNSDLGSAEARELYRYCIA